MLRDMASVRSVTFPRDVLEGISRFYRSGSFVDVTIVCGNFQLHAHRVVLAASSSYFEELFRNFPADRSRLVIAMHNIDWDALRLVVDFIYKGETQIASDKLDIFLEVARSLEIKDLRGAGTAAAAPGVLGAPVPEQATPEHASQNTPHAPMANPSVASRRYARGDGTMEASTEPESDVNAASAMASAMASNGVSEADASTSTNSLQQPETRDVATESIASSAAGPTSRNGVPGPSAPRTQSMRPPDYPVACPSTFNPKGPFERQNDWIWMGKFLTGEPAYFCTGCAALSVNRSVMIRHSELHMQRQ